jgi:hypothetical protein
MRSGYRGFLGLVAAGGLVLAQDAPPPPPAANAQEAQAVPAQTQPPAPATGPSTDQGGWHRIGGSGSDPAQIPQNAPPPQAAVLPPTLTLKPGTFVVVRLNQVLSSDHNKPGDAFTGTLAQPLVVDGFVVAQRGQLIAGTVSQAEKAHHGENLSKLGVTLNSLTLADGNQLPVQSELVTRTGQGWNGRDTGTVVTTGVLGTAIGAVAGGGVGAAIGAGAGVTAGLAGLLLTHGHPTIITPESILTFRVSTAATIATDRSPQSFVPYQPTQYTQAQPQLVRRPYPGPYATPYAAPYAGPYYGYPAPYPYPYVGYYPGIYFGFGGYRRW